MISWHIIFKRPKKMNTRTKQEQIPKFLQCFFKKKPNGPSFYVGIAAKCQQNRYIFKTVGYWWKNPISYDRGEPAQTKPIPYWRSGGIC